MTRWVATSFGALDLTGDPNFVDGTEIAVIPTRPNQPVALGDAPAMLWRRLLEGVAEGQLSQDELALLHQFREFGIADKYDAENATHNIPAPWLSSPLHELVYALVANVADSIDIEFVFIKGPVQHAQGIREREHSGDIDVWLRVRDVDRFIQAMKPWGWTLRTDIFEIHSKTLLPTAWGCTIDVHTRFPGIGLSPDDAFEHLLQRTEEWKFSGIECKVPTTPMSALIRVLHDLRPRPGRPTPPSQLNAVELAIEKAGPAIIILADEFDVMPIVGPHLQRAFPHEVIEIPDRKLPPEWRQLSAPSVASGIWRAIRATPLKDRPRVIFRLVWPISATALASAARYGSTTQNPNVARVQRLWFGTRALATSRARRR